MRHAFYDSEEYRTKQSLLAKKNWKRGIYDFYIKREKRECRRESCKSIFETILSDPKIYCSLSCAAHVNNQKRILSRKTRSKISRSLQGRVNPLKGTVKVPRVRIKCGNLYCKKIFWEAPYLKRKFCSNPCAIKVIGSRPTSPKAARGKAGVRKDIDSKSYFYSRWEANMARLFSYLSIKWVFQPRTFEIGRQKYTPDFYLPKVDTYIEVKNFLSPYSKTRDEKFRKYYPDLKLVLILKKDYLEIQKNYSQLIQNWEYS